MSDLYDIVLVPDPVLKQASEAVGEVNAAVKGQIDRMFATMYDAPGIGLAANQVGITNRVFVMDCAPDCWEYGDERDGAKIIKSAYRSGEGDDGEPDKHPLVMVNPEIVWSSEDKSVFQEGCLSIPQQYADVVRPAQVRVKYVDYDGTLQEQEFSGLPSHCVQHEIDHLDGVLFVDYLSNLKRNMIIRKVEKLKKQQVL